jgi:hypothetical protein
MEVVEWPGGSPIETDIPLSPNDFRKAVKAKSIPHGEALPNTMLLGLPWASIVRVRAGTEASSHFAGPAQFVGGRWILPKIEDEYGREVMTTGGRAAALEWRQRWGFAPRQAGFG